MGTLRFESPASEALVCSCGNTQRGDGFEPCDAKGRPIEPTKAAGWVGHYRCGACGAFTLPKRNPPITGKR